MHYTTDVYVYQHENPSGYITLSRLRERKPSQTWRSECKKGKKNQKSNERSVLSNAPYIMASAIVGAGPVAKTNIHYLPVEVGAAHGACPDTRSAGNCAFKHSGFISSG